MDMIEVMCVVASLAFLMGILCGIIAARVCGRTGGQQSGAGRENCWVLRTSEDAKMHLRRRCAHIKFRPDRELSRTEICLDCSKKKS